MVEIRANLSVITINMNGPNSETIDLLFEKRVTYKGQKFEIKIVKIHYYSIVKI